MFRKRKEPAVPAATISTSFDSNRRKASAPSILSSGLQIVGNMDSAGEVQIDGQFEGNVRCKLLIIGRQGVVKGEIIADEVTVGGRVNGDIRGRKVELLSTAEVEGDILHESLEVQSGAFLNGNCRHSENPLGIEKNELNRAKTRQQASLRNK